MSMDAAATSRRFRDNPSFSSTLLDDIYRSIDQQPTLCTDSVRKKHTKFGCYEDDHDHDVQRRVCLMHKLMENKARQNPVVGRRSAADLDISSMRSYERELFCVNSSSSSCDSCYCCGGVGGGGCSSSETESIIYGGLVKPKPIRTCVYQRDEIIKREKQRIVYGYEQSKTESKREGKFVKTKSKALKIYSDLKKVKQPISPGGRLATFLNSLFANKKPNTTTTTTTATTVTTVAGLDRKSKSANASTCSSVSSFSRSCLINTPSSRGKLNNGIKRSVRFYPEDKNYQPSGHKSLPEEETETETETKLNSIKNDVKLNLIDKNREAARNLLIKYQKKVAYEDEFDDEGSDSSSDLFELDHLSPLGIDKYREELPVYETTQLDTNRLFL